MKNNDTIKDFSQVAIGRIVTIVIQAFFYLVIAALLDPEVYGELSVILALAGTFSVVSLFGLNISTQVYAAKKNYEVTNQIITLFIISTTVAALILLTINQIASILCISLSFFAMTQSQLLGAKQYRKFMIYSIIKSASFSVIPILLYFVFDINGIILGMAISNFLGSFPLFKKLSFRSFFGLKNYYKVLVHNFGVYAGDALPLMLDKLVIVPFFGFLIVGLYAFNLQVIVALGVLPVILNQYLISEESSGVRHRKLSLLVVLASIVLAGIVVTLSPMLIPIFYPQYVEGIESLQILAITIIPQAVGAIFGSKLLAQESTRIGFTSIVRIGGMLILLLVLGEIYGLIGLAAAVLITQCIHTLLLYLLYTKNRQAENNHLKEL
jgi:O-antigen/teichoic acid export membrane protein